MRQLIPTTETARNAKIHTDELQRLGITCLERGWLSANNIVLQGDGPTAVIDSGYASHQDQTVSLIEAELDQRPLDLLLNTHLHSDHCGGNAALQTAYPAVKVMIPPGQASAVENWDPVALTFEPTGQHCPRFTHHGLLIPGTTIQLGTLSWEIHAAKGHDPHSIVLFQPQHRILVSADALWENGFGIVFPELEGVSAFDEVADTLSLIEHLDPKTVLPGHGRVFQDVHLAIERARSRLTQFIAYPEKHRRHALKVLIKFKLLEWQTVSMPNLLQWALNTPYFQNAMAEPAMGNTNLGQDWLYELLLDLQRSGAVSIEGSTIRNG